VHFVILPIAYALAVAATLLLIRHVARTYPSIPKRVALNIRFDGRPSARTGPKRLLWIGPLVLAAVVVVLGALLALDPPAREPQLPLAMAFIIIAEVAWFVAWGYDRQIEIARKMTYRISPLRMLRAFSPILASVVIVLVLALRS
jgi:hypothetical protein